MNVKAISGIPENLTLDHARDWALARVSKKRADHVAGVHKVGRELAEMAELDSESRFMVELACLLHDACKEYKDTQLVALAEEHGMHLTELEKANGHLLHGPVGAFVARQDLGLTNETVLRAISEHTLGNCPMSDISKIVFLADCLDETRPRDYTKPIWQGLLGKGEKKKRSGDDKSKPAAEDMPQVNIDNAMLVALDSSLAYVIETRRAIHPRTVDVRNYFLGIVRASEK
ncbi:MAG: bis(5'-nucleosyl)-tetraphosphatase (symmetrical) YqeK [Cyanobacteria bacterium SZAS TMP-1]|nr:bis(5'-nucleosyl)-tetraphosphatase (symmetrical) YqeK [Cyanobacteria bacterium SZAS TMP-1]